MSSFFARWLILVLLASGAAVQAQEITGSVRGAVLDPSGAGVPTAIVTARQIETGMTRTAVSDRQGTYLLILLPPGHYRIEASARDFQKVVQEGVTLSVNEAANIPI